MGFVNKGWDTQGLSHVFQWDHFDDSTSSTKVGFRPWARRL